MDTVTLPAATPDLDAEHRRLKASSAMSDAPRAMALARLAQETGETSWAVLLLLQAARIWGLNAKGPRGAACLQRAASLARRQGLAADLATVELERGRMLSLMDQYDKALRVLVALLRAPRLAEQLTPAQRSNAWLLLASLAAEVDPPLEHRCLEAAVRACAGAPAASMRSCVGSLAQAWLRGWIYSAECFSDGLSVRPLPPAERQQSLARALDCVRRLPALTDPRSPVQRMLSGTTTALVEAAHERDASRLFATLPELLDPQVTPRGFAYFLLILALSVALALDDLDAATRLDTHLRPLDEECRHLESLFVPRLHATAALARLQGQPERAFEAYRLYAAAWAQRMRSVDLRPADLLQGIDTALASAVDREPPDAGGDAPPWLQTAREAIRQAGLQRLTVDELAAIAKVSPRTLREGFGRHLGVHPRQALEDARLDALQQLMAGGALQDKSLLELAALAGYSHPSRLSRAYRARFGVRLATRGVGDGPCQPRADSRVEG